MALEIVKRCKNGHVSKRVPQQTEAKFIHKFNNTCIRQNILCISDPF